jgi:preprotein translocase subunit SecG
MIQLLLVIHIFLALALVIVVLLQRSEGGALGIGGGGGGGGMMTSRGQANLLTRATAVLAALFMANCLLLAVLASYDRKPRSILDQAPIGQPGSTLPIPASPSPVAPPVAPAAPTAPAAPAAPIAPPTQ